MKAFKYVLFILLLISLSCKEEPTIDTSQEQSSVSTFYLVRHAEKNRVNLNDADPELNQKGLGRAMHWAEILADTELDAIYSTDYNRTSMTAAPTSVKQNIDVQYYDPNTIDIAQFKTENLNNILEIKNLFEYFDIEIIETPHGTIRFLKPPNIGASLD
ncbi:hypothetical protein LCGC14_0292460 [marine sediment metagenome]|uniref:Histidine phosphatase family protein n=1 Tax=marine sediment metagenome TaxID=412755 RepID=A0A0F9WYN8_9ZZZZ